MGGRAYLKIKSFLKSLLGALKYFISIGWFIIDGLSCLKGSLNRELSTHSNNQRQAENQQQKKKRKERKSTKIPLGKGSRLLKKAGDMPGQDKRRNSGNGTSSVFLSNSAPANSPPR